MVKPKPKSKTRSKTDAHRGEKKSLPFKKRRRICIFCADNKTIDYKDIKLLRKFVTDRGKIMSPRGSGCCTLHQRWIARAIKHSRQLGLLPYLVD
jgi:small subunit ribosomal protein S18